MQSRKKEKRHFTFVRTLLHGVICHFLRTHFSNFCVSRPLAPRWRNRPGYATSRTTMPPPAAHTGPKRPLLSPWATGPGGARPSSCIQHHHDVQATLWRRGDARPPSSGGPCERALGRRGSWRWWWWWWSGGVGKRKGTYRKGKGPHIHVTVVAAAVEGKQKNNGLRLTPLRCPPPLSLPRTQNARPRTSATLKK